MPKPNWSKSFNKSFNIYIVCRNSYFGDWVGQTILKAAGEMNQYLCTCVPKCVT